MVRFMGMGSEGGEWLVGRMGGERFRFWREMSALEPDWKEESRGEARGKEGWVLVEGRG